ncbi:hypothetical protein PIB30_099970 [Stylosanthes scabra]|uniref:Uncharacterized protein n=1 Tax=Stylosanthes scabra TaxID=79078 RepID=A0ABU6WV73_9FABA|nr:hypothetical protein [Stylosanthes scabra]
MTSNQPQPYLRFNNSPKHSNIAQTRMEHYERDEPEPRQGQWWGVGVSGSNSGNHMQRRQL